MNDLTTLAPARPAQPFTEPVHLGPDAVAEPLPTGVWIRPTAASAAVDVYRRLLSRGLVGRADVFRVVVGYPDATAIPLYSILEFYRLIPPHPSRTVRFARFGPVSEQPSPEARPTPVTELGQTLADLTGRPTAVGMGVRLLCPTADGGLEARALLPEGALAWTPYAIDFVYRPRWMTGGQASAPVPLDAAPPLPGLPQTVPGGFDLGDGVVVEVTRSGLWLRTDSAKGATAIRAVPPRALQAALVYDSGAQDSAKLGSGAAAELLQRLDPGFRTAAQLIAAETIGLPQGDAAPTRAPLWTAPIASVPVASPLESSSATSSSTAPFSLESSAPTSASATISAPAWSPADWAGWAEESGYA